MAAPRAVSTAELVAAVWGGAAPTTAGASLTNHIARIRAGAGPDVIATAPDGYLLTATTDVALATAEIDEAERSLAHDDADRAFVLVDAALRRWRGAPFVDIAEVDAVRPHQEHLRQLHTHAESLRLEAAIAQRQTGWAVSEAERLLVEDPLDERRWALLVSALDRAGRRGDALAAVDRARRALRDGAGLDLGSRLREAKASLLAASVPRPELRPSTVVGRRASSGPSSMRPEPVPAPPSPGRPGPGSRPCSPRSSVACDDGARTVPPSSGPGARPRHRRRWPSWVSSWTVSGRASSGALAPSMGSSPRSARPPSTGRSS